MSGELDYVVDDQGKHWGTGNVSVPGRMRAVPSWTEAGNDLIPEADWEEFNEWPTGEIPIKDQNGYGACNGHAAATGVEVARYVAGMSYVGLSAWYVYGILGGGYDNGSNISDALTLVEKRGVAPESLMPWGKFNPNRFPAAADATAARFKAELGDAIVTREELMTAVLRRQSLNVSVWGGSRWDNSFTVLDPEGVPGGTGRSTNHAVTVALGAKKSKKWGWLVLMTNSWTEAYGLKGQCWLPIDRIVGAGNWDAYTIKAVGDDPQDKTRPVLV